MTVGGQLMSGSTSRKRAFIITATIVVTVVTGVAITRSAEQAAEPAASGGSGGTATGQAATSAGPLEIVKATWRIKDQADFDATEKIAARVKDGQLRVQVNWATLDIPK